MEIFLKILPLLNTLLIIVGSGWAIYVYFQQQKFRRMQNLSAIWSKFINTEKFMKIFVMCDESSETSLAELANSSSQDKLAYLGLVEEVALYVEQFEVDINYAIYLFQWHFYYAFNDEKTRAAFWKNIGGLEEMNKSYWSKSRSFATKCNPN